MSKDFFGKEYPFAVAYHCWDGLRITPCMTKEEMKKIYDEYKNYYRFIKTIEIKTISIEGD